MNSHREHPLYHLDAETLLVAVYVWVDDELKALQAQGFKLPPKQRHQKATLAELLTLAIVAGPGPGQGLDLKPVPLAHGHRVHGLNLRMVEVKL